MRLSNRNALQSSTRGSSLPTTSSSRRPSPSRRSLCSLRSRVRSRSLLGKRQVVCLAGRFGGFIVEEIERRQADVGDFLLIESGDLKRRRILPEYIGYRSGSRRRKDADGISAGDPPVDAAKDTPAIPSTDTALLVLGRCPFEARFACGIAEFLLSLSFPYPSTKCATNLLHS